MYPFLLFASLTLFTAVVLVFWRQERASLAHPAALYLAFHGFVFVFRPIVAWYYGFDFIYRLYDFEPSQTDKITVVLGANLAMLVFVVTSMMVCNRPVHRIAPDTFENARSVLIKPVLIVTVILAPLGMWSQIANWGQRASRFDTMLRDAATGIQVNTTQVGWFTDLGLVLAPLAVVLVWLGRYRWWSWLVFGGFAILQAGTGIRGPLVFAALSLAIIFMIEAGRRLPRGRSLVLIAVVAFAFNALVMDRGSAVREVFVDESQSRFVSFRELEPLEDMDFANMEYFEYVVYAVPQRSGSYDYFANNLQILTEPIPRIWWPDKPIGSPVQFFSLWDHGRPVGITVSMPGIGWMSLGYPGIIIQSFLMALLYGGLYRWLALRKAGPVALLGYALVAGTSIVVFRDGALLSLIRVLPFYIGPFAMIVLIARLYGWRASSPHLMQANETADPAPDHPQSGPAQRRAQLAARA